MDQDFAAFKINDDITDLKDYLDRFMGQGSSEHQDLNNVAYFIHDYNYGEEIVDLIDELEMKSPEIDRYEFTFQQDILGERSETRECLYVLDDGDKKVIAGSEKGAREYSDLAVNAEFNRVSDGEKAAMVITGNNPKDIGLDFPDREYFSSQEFRDDLKSTTRDLALTLI